MKTHFYLLLLFTLIAFGACKEDEQPMEELAELMTIEVQDIEGESATMGGNITSAGSGTINGRGVCWSKNANPTINDNSEWADGSGLGNFTVNVEQLEPNTTYNVRAWAQNDFGIAYGNNITFETTSLVSFTTDIATRIIPTRATLTGRVDGRSAGAKGFVLSTSPNPTVNDIKVQDGVNVGDIQVFLINLTPNTTYYARPYAYAGTENHYGEEITFKTTGYFGPAGGYVIFDKGEETDDWRYLEAAPTVIADNYWGCDGTFISGTYPEEGTGLENTNRIALNCTEANCAARICFDHQLNGFADWFLPSREEAVILMRSLDDISSTIAPSSLWTSSETAGDKAFHVYWSGNDIIKSSISKGSRVEIIPVRRYK